MVFETKKIQLDTLSEYLVEIRENLGLSSHDVVQKTGIKAEFLDALETGRLNRLPPTVYVLGFLRLLATLYAIDAQLIIDQFKKERGIQEHMNKLAGYDRAQTHRTIHRFIVTPKVLSAVLGSLFVAVTLLYVVWQVFSINKTPALEIMEPKDRQIIKDSFITVSGKTDPGMLVTINDENVFVDEKGNFKTQLGIGQGPKDLVFTAKNKFDKAIVKKVVVVGEIPVAVKGAEDRRIILELTAADKAEVTTQSDNGDKTVHMVNAGDSFQVVAQDKILLSTNNAGALKVVFNGKDMGVLGKPKETLKDIPFFQESGSIK